MNQYSIATQGVQGICKAELGQPVRRLPCPL